MTILKDRDYTRYFKLVRYNTSANTKIDNLTERIRILVNYLLAEIPGQRELQTLIISWLDAGSRNKEFAFFGGKKSGQVSFALIGIFSASQ